jgi:hypothetical protein
MYARELAGLGLLAASTNQTSRLLILSAGRSAFALTRSSATGAVRCETMRDDTVGGAHSRASIASVPAAPPRGLAHGEAVVAAWRR